VPSRSPQPPADIVARAHERAAARAARDWARADALRAEIESAGWRVVDGGTAFHLAPAVPPTFQADGRTRYGHADAVPPLLDEPADAPFSVHLLADDRPDDLDRALAALRAHAPAGTQVVIVANDPSAAQAERLAPGGATIEPIGGRLPDVAWTSARLGCAAARNIGLRRASGDIVVLAEPSVELTGDALGPLSAALADPGVAVAGAFGLVSTDLRHFDGSPGPGVDAIDGAWLAFRRVDYRQLGPLDERFVAPGYLDAWWSLVLRAGLDPAAPPRGARCLDLPLIRSGEPQSLASADVGTDRLAKRNYYRLLDRFRERADELLTGGRSPAG
jgi:Glycosyl transferase family 2